MTADHRADREQTLLAQAEELAGAGSWDADLVAGTVQWSAGMYRIRDLEPCGEPISLALASADMHPADGPRVEAELAAALRTGCDQVSLSYRIVTGAGTRHLEGRARIEHDGDGVPVRMIGVTMDVSARRETEIAREQAERELRAREGLLSAVIENNPALIYAKDLEGRYLLYNEPLAEAFELERRGALEGCPARSVLLGRTDDWLDPELAPLWREADLRARLGTHRVEERLDHPQDGERFFDSIKFPLHDDDGYVIGTCGVSLETTKAKLLEAQAVRSSRYFDLTRDLVCTAGLDGHFKDLNDAWTQTLGWSAEELRARPFVEFVHADDRPQTEVIAAGLATGAPAGQFVNRYATKRGDWRWLEWTAMMEDGTIYASARDITERKRAEDQIVRNEKLLADLLNSAPDAVVIADADWRITLVNAQTERLFGYERDELVGAPLQALMAERLRGRDAADDEDFGSGPAVRPITARSDLAGRRKDGSDFSVDVSLSAVESDDGRLVIAFVRDSTERRRAEDELARAHEGALEASRLKSEFVANMSHEIRTPLHGVIGMSGLLLGTELADEQREYAEAIGVSADALMGVISDILDFSKIEAGKLELDHHRFDLRELVDAAASMLAADAHAKDVELMAWVHDDLAGSVIGDAARVRQVLSNLLTNAVKFTSAGEVIVRVTPETAGDGSPSVLFAISDTGIGIDPAALERIFGAFSQADASTTRKYGGTGLGLAICQQLVELMGGTIGVASELGVGSTFRFTIPAAAPVAVDELRDLGCDFAGTRVLVVDDNATNRSILEHQLSRWKMTCDTAGDGPEALALMRAAAQNGAPYDLAIIDSRMPEMDGMHLTLRVRATPELLPMRLLMLTSSGSGRDVATRASVDGFVTKPAREARLKEEIALILDAGPAARPQRRAQAQVLAPREPGSGGLTVLVAEDNVVNQLVVTRLLEQRGLQVDVAHNGREAVAMHGCGDYALIFMDCQMPELDGYGATAAIRLQEPASRHTPIVAMTANTLKGDRERCLAAGMDDYVGKPLRPGELEEVLARALVVVPAPLVDPAGFSETMGGDDEARGKLVTLFLDRSQDAIVSFAAAIDAGDPVTAARVTHGLKGSAAVMGAVRLEQAAVRLQHALDAGEHGSVAGLRGELERTFELTRSAYVLSGGEQPVMLQDQRRFDAAAQYVD